MQRELIERFIKQVISEENKPVSASLFKYIAEKFGLHAPIKVAINRHVSYYNRGKKLRAKPSDKSIFLLRDELLTNNHVIGRPLQLATRLLRDRKFKNRVKYGVLTRQFYSRVFVIVDNELINYINNDYVYASVPNTHVIVFINDTSHMLDRSVLMRVAYIAKTLDEFEILVKRVAKEI